MGHVEIAGGADDGDRDGQRDDEGGAYAQEEEVQDRHRQPRADRSRREKPIEAVGDLLALIEEQQDFDALERRIAVDARELGLDRFHDLDGVGAAGLLHPERHRRLAVEESPVGEFGLRDHDVGHVLEPETAIVQGQVLDLRHGRQ